MEIDFLGNILGNRLGHYTNPNKIFRAHENISMEAHVRVERVQT
jgi:hypothetical protein